MSLLDEEFNVLGENELMMSTKRFERLHQNRVNRRRTTDMLPMQQARTLRRLLSGEDGEQGRLQAPVEDEEQAPVEARLQA
jgi:hypothetical protein